MKFWYLWVYQTIALQCNLLFFKKKKWQFWNRSQNVLNFGLGCPTLNACFRLACCLTLCYGTWSLLQSQQLTVAMPLWLITEQHCLWVELKSTVWDLPWRAKISRRCLPLGHPSATRSSLCGKWQLRSCTNIIIKAASYWEA